MDNIRKLFINNCGDVYNCHDDNERIFNIADGDSNLQLQSGMPAVETTISLTGARNPMREKISSKKKDVMVSGSDLDVGHWKKFTMSLAKAHGRSTHNFQGAIGDPFQYGEFLSLLEHITTIGDHGVIWSSLLHRGDAIIESLKIVKPQLIKFKPILWFSHPRMDWEKFFGRVMLISHRGFNVEIALVDTKTQIYLLDDMRSVFSKYGVPVNIWNLNSI